MKRAPEKFRKLLAVLAGKSGQIHALKSQVGQLLDARWQLAERVRSERAAWEVLERVMAERDVLRQDNLRLDYLARMVVQVRVPLRYGSELAFYASPRGLDEDEITPSNIRDQIDLAMTVDPERVGGKS